MYTSSRVSPRWEGCCLDSTSQVCQLSLGQINTCKPINGEDSFDSRVTYTDLNQQLLRQSIRHSSRSHWFRSCSWFSCRLYCRGPIVGSSWSSRCPFVFLHFLAHRNCSPSFMHWKRNADCRSSVERHHCGYHVVSGSGLSCRDLQTFTTWCYHYYSTIGHRMGYPHHVSRLGMSGELELIPQRYFIGYGCSYIGDVDSTTSFRTAWGIQFVPCVFFMIGLPFLPESPRWLAKVDRVDEALHILANIQADGDLENVIAELEEIMTVLAAERLALKSWRKFVYNGMWRRTLAGFSVQAWQQLSGANVMTYYIVYIFCNTPNRSSVYVLG
jgi:hypothetical protein